MPDRRTLAAALVLGAACTALTAPTMRPAFADPKDPTVAERRAAQAQVGVARSTVTNLQAKAEYAIEVHNGLLVKARAATAVREAATSRAESARAALTQAQQAADQAVAEAATAASAAVAADQASAAARDAATKAQVQLDTMAAGAFRGQGRFGMIAMLLTAHDPTELANGHHLMNSVADQQSRVIAALDTARVEADRAAAQAAAARAEATATATAATRAVAQREQARAAAESANHEAALDAQAAHLALDDAHRAKARAAALVARAEDELHHAVLTAAQLERAAAAAKRAAEAARRAAAASGRAVAPSDAAATAIRWAYEEIGVPYSWGGGDESGPTYGFAQGAGTKGFDCSGLTLFAYAKAGIHLDHYTGSQWNQGRRISSRSDLRPGDLMFFAYDTSDSSTIHHVSIYLGDGKMIEAPYTGEVVRVASADRSDFIGGTRPWA